MEKMLTALQQLEASHKCNEKLQTMVNKVGLAMKVDMAKAIAMSAHADLPIYEDKWDKGWELIRIHKDVKGRAGLYFRKGDYAIFNHVLYQMYSIRVGINTSANNIYFSEV